MTQLGFFVDVSKCSGCKTCAVACKDAHNLPVGMNFRKVHEYAGGTGNRLLTDPGHKTCSVITSA